MTTTITERSALEAIRETFTTGTSPVAAEDIIAYCDKKLASLDNKAAKARERAAAKRAESDVLLNQVADALTDEFAVIADITAVVANVNPDVTVARVTNRLTKLCAEGRAEKTQITIPGVDGSKSRKVSAYRKTC